MNFDSTLTNHRSQIGSDSAGRAVLCMPLPGPNGGAHGTWRRPTFHYRLGRGNGAGRCRGVGEGLGVSVGMEVAVGVAVAVAVAVGVGVGLGGSGAIA